MAIQVYCPNSVCANHTRPRAVPDEMAGRQVNCRACGLVLTIPQARFSARAAWWLMPLAGAIAAAVVLAAVAWVLLGMGAGADKKDETPTVAALPDPVFDAGRDRKNPSVPELLPPPPVAAPEAIAVPKLTPPPIQTHTEREIVKPPVVEPAPAPERRPEPRPQAPPPPRRERPASASDTKFIIPFDAVGPAAKLDRIKVTQVEGRFSFAGSTAVNPVTMTWQSTTRFKWHEKATSLDIAFLVDGNKGWFGDGRKVRPMEADGFSFYQNLAYSISLSNLLPLRDKGFEIVKGEDVSVRGRNCLLARVKAEGRPEMKMYFDKQTGFLTKAEFRGRFFSFNDLKLQKEATLLENYFSNYKKIDGVNHWRRYEQYRNGVKYAELNLDRVQFFDKIDDKWFSFDKSRPPGLDPGNGEWKITRLLPEKKRAGVKSPALQVTVMFNGTQAPSKVGKSYRVVDADGLVLDKCNLRFTSSTRRYGTLSFERILAGSDASLRFDGLFLEDDVGRRAALQLGAAARK
ncbi:MAG: hypothetical protein FJ271_12450 [Planctomycetes bacterium]|nr:hypothetical protein [Planctomycetota bacterium]